MNVAGVTDVVFVFTASVTRDLDAESRTVQAFGKKCGRIYATETSTLAISDAVLSLALAPSREGGVADGPVREGESPYQRAPLLLHWYSKGRRPRARDNPACHFDRVVFAGAWCGRTMTGRDQRQCRRQVRVFHDRGRVPSSAHATSLGSRRPAQLCTARSRSRSLEAVFVKFTVSVSSMPRCYRWSLSDLADTLRVDRRALLGFWWAVVKILTRFCEHRRAGAKAPASVVSGLQMSCPLRSRSGRSTSRSAPARRCLAAATCRSSARRSGCRSGPRRSWRCCRRSIPTIERVRPNLRILANRMSIWVTRSP